MSIKKILLIDLSLILLVWTTTTCFVVDETQQAIIVQFGKPIEVIVGSDNLGKADEARMDIVKDWLTTDDGKDYANVQVSSGPGIWFKLPWPVQNVKFFDDRVLDYQSLEQDVITKDKKTLVVNNYARWRIINPLQFLTKIRSESQAERRLDDIIYSVLRNELGGQDFESVIRTTDYLFEVDQTLQSTFHHVETGRWELLKAVTTECNTRTIEYGITTIDVRIKRVGLPQQNLKPVFDRMIAERQRIAMLYRAEGGEAALKIKADADKEVTVAMATAYHAAEKLRGEGDAEATKIYNSAYKVAPEFYTFWRSMQAYQKVYGQGGENTPHLQFILTPDNRFFRMMDKKE